MPDNHITRPESVEEALAASLQLLVAFRAALDDSGQGVVRMEYSSLDILKAAEDRLLSLLLRLRGRV